MNVHDINPDGSVMTRDQIREKRLREGFCIDCKGVPVQLYRIEKAKFNPLWKKKTKLTKKGESLDGKCLRCYPHLDPDRKQNRRSGRKGKRPSFLRPKNKTNENLDANSNFTSNTKKNSISSNNPAPLLKNSNLAPSNNSIPLLSKVSPSPSNNSIPTVSSTLYKTPYESSNSIPTLRKVSPTPSHNSIPSVTEMQNEEEDDQMNFHMERVFLRKQEESSRRLLRQKSVRGVTPLLVRQTSEKIQKGRGEDSMKSVLGSITAPVRKPSYKHSLGLGLLDREESEEELLPPPPVEESQQNDLSLSEITAFVKDISDAGNPDVTVDVLVQFMKDYKNSVEILEFCIGKIWDFCKASEDYKSSVISTSAPDDILRAMQSHLKNASIQEQCCGALWSLCTSPKNRMIIIRAGASPRIIRAFIEHIENEDVVSTGLGCLRTISPEAEARESISSLSGVDYVCKAMKVHRNIAWIQRDGCAFLSNCAVDVAKQQVALASDAEIEAIMDAMFTHKNDPSVIAGGCFAIKNFAHDERNIRRFRVIEGITDLIQETSQFCEDMCAREDARNILSMFEASESDDFYLETMALTSIPDLKVENYSTMPAQKIRQGIELMEEYAWSRKVFAAILETLTFLGQQYPDQKEEIASDHVIENVITYMKKYANSDEIQVNGCELLHEIVKDDQNSPSKIYELDGCECIVAAMVKYPSQRQIQHAGRHVLDAISNLFESKVEFDCYMRSCNSN